MPGRPTTSAYGRAGACCACSRYEMDGLCFFFFKFRLSYLPFLMPYLFETAGHTEILWSGHSNPAIVVSYYRRHAR